MTTQHPTYGFFGKIPAVGDFVQRNLSRPVADAIDNWLQQGMFLMSRQEPAFLENYCAASTSFFILPPQSWANQAVAGFIIPSYDRVGRQYPLVVVRLLQPQQPALPAQLSGELEYVCNSVITCLQHGAGPDALQQHLLECAAVSPTTDEKSVLIPAPEHLPLNNTSSLWWRKTQNNYQQVKTFNSMDPTAIFEFLYQKQIEQ